MSDPPFWGDKPSVLFAKGTITELWPSSSMDQNAKVNAVARLVIVLTILGFAITGSPQMMLTGLVTLICIYVLRKVETAQSAKKGGKETFVSASRSDAAADAGVFVQPTPANPAMNVLLPEINRRPPRKEAAPAFAPTVAKDIKKNVQASVIASLGGGDVEARLFQDLGDDFQFDQSMRTWYATPSTRVPNDQKAFADFCYGDMKSCKDGQPLACQEGAPPHWINGQQ